MDVQTAKITLELLARVELKGAEVPAFNAVVSALQEIISAEAEAQESE